MIRGIRRRFIRIALAVLALAMVMVVVIINAANWFSVRAELYETVNALSEGDELTVGKGGRTIHMKNMLGEARYFVVIAGQDDRLKLKDRSHLTDAEDDEKLTDIASEALKSGRRTGFCEDYLYVISEQREGTVAVFLNCETKLARVRRLALISTLACGGLILLAWLLVALFSQRAIKPLIENTIRQKQFITDAGHELKTPLTVISANMDVLSLDNEDNEWIRSTQRQVANMRGLVNELIYLSRLDEEDSKLAFEPVDLSDLVRETADPFAGMAEFSGKAVETDIQEGVHMNGDRAALTRLVSILCDNAVKYAPDGDRIALTLRQNRREILFTVENGLNDLMSGDALSHLFDRFYRADQSRSRESGGFGIGLSVAWAIVEKHGGSIQAAQDGERRRIQFTCRFLIGARG